MALTDEQRAMLQLLLEGGQGYEDIGSLLGIAPDEVRSRARSALQEMGGADPDAKVGLSDYLLGQADPIGRADAVRQLQNDPETNALAERLVQQLRLIAPKAQLPELPAAKGGRRAAPAPPPPSSAPSTPAQQPATEAPASAAPAAPAKPGIASRAAEMLSGKAKLSGHRGRQASIAIIAAIALIVVVVVLVTGGGGDSGDDCGTVDTAQAQQASVPTIKLNAAGSAADADCPPTGQVTLAAVPQQTTTTSQTTPQFALQLNAANLEPTGDQDTYLLWLYKSDTEAFPLGQQTVDDSGNLTGAVPLTSAQVLLLTAFDQMRLSKVTSAEVTQVQQAVQAQGKKNSTGVVAFSGTPVLEGSMAELGLDQILQQAQSQAGGAGGAGGGTGQAPQGGQGSGAQ